MPDQVDPAVEKPNVWRRFRLFIDGIVHDDEVRTLLLSKIDRSYEPPEIVHLIVGIFIGPLEANDAELNEVLPLVGLFAAYSFGVILLIKHFSDRPGWWWFVLYCGALLFFLPLGRNYIRAVSTNLKREGGWPDRVTPPEPAYRSYFFRKAFHDSRYIVIQAAVVNYRFVQYIWYVVGLLIANPVFPLVWLIGVPLSIPLLVSVGAGTTLVVGLSILHLVLVSCVCLVMFIMAGIFRVYEYTLMVSRRIYVVCPNAGCYRSIPLPVFLCRKCHAEHRKLIPGEYGVFHRRCQCGEKLPTLFITGRCELASLCPHQQCHKPLPLHIDTLRAVHVALVGGSNAGKTTVLAAIANSLREHAELALHIPDGGQRRRLEEFRRMLADGQYPLKTRDRQPQAFVSYLQDQDSKRAALYLYDPAGEAYGEINTLRAQRFQSVVKGVMFLVDPLSVRAFTAGPEGGDNGAAVSTPQSLYDSFRIAFQDAQRNGGLEDAAIAVVITKSDLLKPLGQAPRDWLESYGLRNLIASIEGDFKRVRYFYGSVARESTGSATVRGLGQALHWLLGFSGLSIPLEEEESVAVRVKPRSA